MINIGISKKNCHEIAKLLNHLLANEYVLYTKTWKFHWNIEGKHFGALHAFLDAQRIQLGEIVDEVAERVRALDVKSIGTLTEFLEKTSLEEHPGKNPDDLGMLKLLVADHEEIIKKIRQDADFVLEKCGDAGTNNFLCDLLEKHEKMAWMLRAHIQ
jgi:starvation-inducible DNA-binding protein